MGSLPRGIPVEIEVIVEIEDDAPPVRVAAPKAAAVRSAAPSVAKPKAAPKATAAPKVKAAKKKKI
jgi:hypothetical protein